MLFPDFVDASPKMAHEFFYVEKRLDHLLLIGQEQGSSRSAVYSVCPDVNADDGLCNFNHLVNTQSNATELDDSFKFLVDFVCYETDTDVSFNSPFSRINMPQRYTKKCMRHPNHLEI